MGISIGQLGFNSNLEFADKNIAKVHQENEAKAFESSSKTNLSSPKWPDLARRLFSNVSSNKKMVEIISKKKKKNEMPLNIFV